jgi:hypothetical protein
MLKKFSLQTCLKKHEKSGIQIKIIKVDTINKRTLLKTKKDHALTKIVSKKIQIDFAIGQFIVYDIP